VPTCRLENYARHPEFTGLVELTPDEAFEQHPAKASGPEEGWDHPGKFWYPVDPLEDDCVQFRRLHLAQVLRKLERAVFSRYSTCYGNRPRHFGE
jgi:hypothetical protein